VTRRAGPSATAVLALLFSLIALAAAGYSYWTQREASKSAVRPAAVDSLGIRLDTLAAQVQRLEQPFGPSTSTAPDSGAAATRSAIPR
jgi:uncharacterized protein HemX